MTVNAHAEMKRVWEESFAAQIAGGAYNTAPVEALVRSVAYYLRDRHPDPATAGLRFCELGCGAGPNLRWLAAKGIEVSGVDISPTALDLARRTLEGAGFGEFVGELVEASVHETPFANGSFDGILEACVFQHLPRPERERAFAEVGRLLKPGGVFVGYMLERGHTVFGEHEDEQLADDPGTVELSKGGSRFHLTNIGLTHFFDADEVRGLLSGFEVVDPCLTTYYLPRSEAKKRGYENYLQSMLTVYAIK